MKVAIIAYPAVSDRDRRWIEHIRAAHDPQATLIAAHFTLVFPTETEASPVVGHAMSVLKNFRRISFVLRRARAVSDFSRGHGGHVFLVPEQGADEICMLHDRLYGGALKPHLRTDIPFVPHITIGACNELGECERIVDRLNDEQRVIAGHVNGVEIVEGDSVRAVARLPFGIDEP